MWFGASGRIHPLGQTVQPRTVLKMQALLLPADVASFAPPARVSFEAAHQFSKINAGDVTARTPGRFAQSGHLATLLAGALPACLFAGKVCRRWRKKPGLMAGKRIRRQCAPARAQDGTSTKELAQKAARERASLRMGDLPEEERERMISELDYLAPYRTIVLGFGSVFVLAGLADLFFTLVKGKSLEDELVTLLGFEAFTGGLCIYAGLVWMAPPKLPTMNELLQDAEAVADEAEAGDAEKVPPTTSKKRGSMIGKWSYGLFNKQEFVIDRDENGTWLFTEELDGQTFSGVLTPTTTWLQGDVFDDETGSSIGTIRLRPGPDDTALSCFRKVGEIEWSAELSASLVCRLKKDVPKQPALAADS